MKVCIPVSSPDGLSSRIDSSLEQARYLHIHNLEDHSFEEIDLSQSGLESKPVIEFHAVACASIHRHAFMALRQQGKVVYLSESVTVAQLLNEFAQGNVFMIPDTAGGCSGGGCHGHHSQEHEQSGCQCQSSDAEGRGGCGGGSACGGHNHDGHSHAGHDKCCPDNRTVGREKRKVRRNSVKVAVTSQNRKTVTEHAGKCRKFWIYETHDGRVLSKTLLELPLEQSLHSSSPEGGHVLDDVDILVTASIGDGLKQRLNDKGIETIVTDETDPDAVVDALMATMQ